MTLLKDGTWQERMLAGGWRRGGAGTLPVTSPATGERLATVGAAGPEDVAAAAGAAADAQRAWAARPHQERAAVLRRAGELFEQHAEEIGGWLAAETGAAPGLTHFQTATAAEECHEAAGLASHPYGELLRTAQPQLSMARRVPVGVVGVTATVEAGARLAAGGTYDGLFYRPTVLGDVPATAPAFTREIFGPVAPVTTFETEDEAVELAGATEYGLSLGILTGDLGRALRLADRIPSGLVHINDQTVNDEPTAPFGGVGASGTGSRHGGPQANLEAFTETQWLTLRAELPHYPF
ncbi:aldehyde dehydrogenase family protein [Streptomyces sp. NPDC055400]